MRGLAFDDENKLYVCNILANAIYKIEIGNDHKISVLKKDNRLGNPHGMVYDSVLDELIVVTRATGKLLKIGKDGKIARPSSRRHYKICMGLTSDGTVIY